MANEESFKFSRIWFLEKSKLLGIDSKSKFIDYATLISLIFSIFRGFNFGKKPLAEALFSGDAWFDIS